MISRRSLNSEVSHGPGGVDPEPGTKPVGRSDLAHPLITQNQVEAKTNALHHLRLLSSIKVSIP